MRHAPFSLAALSFTIFSSVTSPAAAQSGNQHIDINPYDSNGADPGGQILTGFFDFDSDSFIQDVSVFSEPLDIIQSGFHGVSAPGLFASGDFTLRPSTDVSFDIPAVSAPVSTNPSTLFYWDGIDDDGNGNFLEDVDFTAPPPGHSLQVRLSTFVNTTVAGESTDQPGFVIDRTNSDGGIHKHVSFLIRGDAGNAPDDGLYLLPFRLHQAGLENSDPFFLLFNGKYERDGNDAIIFNGILPRTNADARAAAVLWLNGLFATALTGDYNASGQVEQGDLDLVLQNWGDDTDVTGIPTGWTNDNDQLGQIEQTELDRVLQNWGSTSAPDFQSNTLPEPTSALGLLLLSTLHRRRPAPRQRPKAKRVHFFAGTKKRSSPQGPPEAAAVS